VFFSFRSGAEQNGAGVAALCWRALANSGTAWAGLRLNPFIQDTAESL